MFARKAKFMAALLLVGSQASAGTSYSLSSLLSGGTLNSDNGKLVFSDFAYSPYSNAPAATDITVKSLTSGLGFAVPFFTISGVVDFNISYKVTGVDATINGVQMQSTGSGTGTGVAGIYKVVEDGNNVGLANLTNAFGASTTIGTSSATFADQASILVRDDIFGLPGNQGTAGISDFEQTFTTGGDTSAVPTPTAALAGLAIMGIVGLRRRRQEATAN